MASKTVDEFFWDKVDKTDTCWLWMGNKNAGGYGQIGARMRGSRLAHRFSWELRFGPPPKNLCVCHHCDNPSCVRPDHLFLGTPLENTRDSDFKGRRRPTRGEENPSAKLSEADVRQIRLLFAAGGVTKKELGRQFGVSAQEAMDIINLKKWRHIT